MLKHPLGSSTLPGLDTTMRLGIANPVRLKNEKTNEVERTPPVSPLGVNPV